MRKVRTTELLLRGHKNATVLGTDKDGNVVSKTADDLDVFSDNPKNAQLLSTNDEGEIIKADLPNNAKLLATDSKGDVIEGQFPENPKNAQLLSTNDEGEIIKADLPSNAKVLATDSKGNVIEGQFPAGGGSGGLVIGNKANIILGREYKSNIIVDTSSLQGIVSDSDWAHISEFKYVLIAQLDKAVEGDDIKVCVRVITNYYNNYPTIIFQTEAFGRIKANGATSYIGLSSYYFSAPIPNLANETVLDMLVKITSPDSRLLLQSYEFLTTDRYYGAFFIPLSTAGPW